MDRLQDGNGQLTQQWMLWGRRDECLEWELPRRDDGRKVCLLTEHAPQRLSRNDVDIEIQPASNLSKTVGAGRGLSAGWGAVVGGAGPPLCSYIQRRHAAQVGLESTIGLRTEILLYLLRLGGSQAHRRQLSYHAEAAIIIVEVRKQQQLLLLPPVTATFRDRASLPVGCIDRPGI
jgi:hypothetical protein